MEEMNPVVLNFDSKDQVGSLPYPTRINIIRLYLQMVVGLVLLLPFNCFMISIMKYFRNYKIENIKEVRAQFKDLIKDGRPLIICSNHLTFIDSALMLWAMGNNFWYLFHYRWFSWNLPAGDFFKKKWIFRVVAYLGKCIFIHRDGTREHKNMILGLCQYLVGRGQIVTIFPEGRRSRKGIFEDDHVTLGASQIVVAVPGCRVLCVYLRSDKQKEYSNYPAKNSKFNLLMEVITPTSEKEGRRALVEISSQIGTSIKTLEHRHFARFGNPF
jgi:1-acyl-sn-glycerol-3-phosphate acyltransferase